MQAKKGNGKKNGFPLAPITLAKPVKTTDGFTNLVDAPPLPADKGKATKAGQGSDTASSENPKTKDESSAPHQTVLQPESPSFNEETAAQSQEKEDKHRNGKSEEPTESARLTEAELLRILDADGLDEIYELTDVLRASSLKLYAALVRLADSRGRARVKNHELMAKAGIKGIATLYKQERWLIDLKLLEKKAKPGPHDGSSYVVRKLECLPLPAEIYEKFDEYLAAVK